MGQVILPTVLTFLYYAISLFLLFYRYRGRFLLLFDVAAPGSMACFPGWQDPASGFWGMAGSRKCPPETSGNVGRIAQVRPSVTWVAFAIPGKGVG